MLLAAEPIAHVAELWRYPVKGMHGEALSQLEVVEDGVAGDRRYAFESSGAPTGKPMLTGLERTAMLLYSAATVDGNVLVRTPEGQRFPVEDPGCAAALQEALPRGNRIVLRRGSNPFTDCRPIAMLSLQTIEALSAGYGSAVDARRFRANILLGFPEGTADTIFPEDALVGRTIRIGATAQLRITERDPRCRMVTLDPETAAADPALMKYLDRHHGGKLGIYAATVVPGSIRVGDPVRLVS